MREKPASLTLVIPLYNEEAMIPTLVARLASVFGPEARQSHGISEVRYVFVDDGSKDASVASLTGLAPLLGKSQIVRFSRNFGHQAAVSAGLGFAEETDVAAIIDADLQDPPECILEMLALWRQGYDVVYGERANRKEGPFKVFLYWAFYRVYKFLSPIDVPVDSGDFSLMSREVVRQLNALPEKLRFSRGLRAWVGFRQIGLKYDRPERALGETKYSLRKLYQLATDGIAALSLRPLKLAQGFATVYLFVSLVLITFILFKTATAQPETVFFYILAAIILFSNSLVLLCLHILGAYVGRMYLEVKGRPNHVVSEVLALSAEATRSPHQGQLQEQKSSVELV